ncbi:hypothetical protein [Arthrobacter sp. YN]|uniref:hypothetical protein n=1 Tax=Arthrobacter sp. YN TaxID=2020486 RepID=UPI001E52D755|nr:hypothetical protein [Arthrobacter sp. YN]
MAFLCLFDCWCGRRDQQNDPAPSVVLLPPYLPGLTLQVIPRRYFRLTAKIIMLAYAFMMKAAAIREDVPRPSACITADKARRRQLRQR